MIDLDAMFEGGLMPNWFARFAEDPEPALGDLLVGCADVGVLVAEEPTMLLLDWLQRFGDTGGFAPAVDEALAQWTADSWGNPTLEAANNSASLTAVAWCRAAEVIAMDNRLAAAAAGLRERMLSDRRFLAAITEGRTRDPQGRAWLAIARHQKDRQLLDEWWRLCSLPPDEPWYRGEYGIHGLRGLPAEHPQDEGRFPEAVAQGLCILGRALETRAKDEWLPKGIAREEFLRTARMTMVAYPFPEVWNSFWREAVRSRKPVPEEWVAKLADLEQPTDRQRQLRTRQRVWTRPDPQWSKRAQSIASKLKSREESAIQEAEELIEEQADYAESTGDTEFVVRSACNFAGSAQEWRSDRALEWSETARHFDPWDPHGWNVGTTSLLRLGRIREALQVGVQAVRLFPRDVFARTGLAEVLKAADRLVEAEEVYRETVELFPRNVVARTGLGEVLKEAGRLPEAEAVYRETKELFPRNAHARNGLGEVLKAAGRLPEAEAVYRETVDDFPRDVFARTGLAEVLKAADRLDEAEAVYRETIKDFPDNVVARTGLAEVLKAADRLEEAEAVYRETVELFPDNAHARTGLESVLKALARSGAPEEPDMEAEEPCLPETTAQEEPPSPAEEGLRPDDIEILLTDAYLLRRWGRRTAPGDLIENVRVRARELLSSLAAVGEGNPLVAEQRGLLLLETGELDEAISLLREAQARFPGSARVQYALARAQRERAGRDGRHLDGEAKQKILLPWQRLARRGQHYRPLGNLGEGRAYLALADGSALEDGARDAFGRLGRWIGRQTKQVDSETKFSSWWAREVQSLVFGETSVTGAADLDDLDPLRERVKANATLLDEREEDYAYHYASV